MEKELLETFAAAKRAADALDGGGGKAEADRCIDALERLQRLPVTVNDLVATQVGKNLRGLTKNRHEKIKAVASDLLKLWKDLVVQETTRADNKNNTPRNPSRADNRNSSPRNHSRAENGNNTPRNPSRADEISNAGVVKSEDRNGVENTKENAANGPIGSKAGAVKAEGLKGVENNTKKSSSGPVGAKAGAVQPEGLNRVENNMTKPSSAPICPPKLNSVPKCNIPVRDRLREVLAEAFSRVSKETRESKRDEVRNIWDEVDACEPVRAAVTVESAMFEKLGASTGAHKVKYRSIMFNLKDGKNPDFRRRVLLGQIDLEDLGDMTPEEMASDERKRENRQIKEKALFECERGAAPKATTDQFKCGRCGQRKTTYYQMQTRSADEPMTTFVTCVNCNNHWKFC